MILDFTFDWERNKHAAKAKKLSQSEKGPRQIDRFYVGYDLSLICSNEISHLFECKLLGESDTCDYPPSDHFSVSFSFGIQHDRIVPAVLYNPNEIHNSWAKAAIPSSGSLLALVLQDSTYRGINLFDQPLPHVNLLKMGSLTFLWRRLKSLL